MCPMTSRRARPELLWVLVAAVLWLGWAPSASAFGPPSPQAESASTIAGKPVVIALEATDDFGADAVVTFSIAGDPAHGSLSALGPTNCTYTATTSDCTASVTYTPASGYTGRDSFTYQASDQFATSTSATVTVTVAAPPAPAQAASIVPGSALVEVGSPYTATATGLVAGATVSYGDGAAAPLVVNADGTAAISHVYASEGSYVVTVANPSSSQPATALVQVLVPGPSNVASGAIGPGATGTVGLPGVTATLTTSPADAGPASLLTATYPPSNPAFAGAAPQGLVLGAFDVRAIGIGAADRLVVRFSYRAPAGSPAPSLEFFDPRRGAYVPVRGSTRVPNSLVVDTAAQTITVIVDDTSTPSLASLTLTRFAVVGGMPLILVPIGPQLLIDKRQLNFIVSCGAVACRLAATGTLAIPGTSGRWRLGHSEVTLAPGQYRRVQIPTSPALRAAARAYLRRGHRRLEARLRITVTGPGQLHRTRLLTIVARTLAVRR